MAFTIRKTKNRAWPVTVMQFSVDENSGEVQEVKSTFVAQFRLFSEAEFSAIADEVKAAFPAPDGDEGKVTLPVTLSRNAALYARLIAGWGPEVRDEQAQPIPFSVDLLVSMVTGPDGLALSNGLNEALTQLRLGIAPAKNAETSPAPGPTPSAVEAALTS